MVWHLICKQLVVGDNAKRWASCAQARWLGVESGRHEGAALHRNQRLCQRCGSGEVDDEDHMVFRCAALSAERQEHASLFSPWPENLRSFMGQDPKTLAAFAYACYKRDKELKTCNLPVRTARRTRRTRR